MYENGSEFDYIGKDLIFKDLWLPLAGKYQIDNALIAIECFLYLMKDRDGISESNIREGLKNLKWRGRLEILSRKPLTIGDVAHNPDSISKLVSTISSVFSFDKIHCVLSISRNKDVVKICEILNGFCDNYYITCAEEMRSSSIDSVAFNLSKDKKNKLFQEAMMG